MVNGIGSGASGRDGLASALQRMQKQIAELQNQKPEASAAPQAEAFQSSMAEAVSGLDAQMRATDDLPVEALKGDVDLHEVAAHLKESEITFQFALTVRNKLLDAYREVMRMSV